MENKFKKGEVVKERIRPSQKLIITRHINKLYYCKIEENPNLKELVYFERELMPVAAMMKQELVTAVPVVALADAGIAMGGLGSDTKIETADIVIQK